ncbi:hypothetical protein BpHYR1_014338 [Brachionus plicatilis]|uniref:Uncharacterized protein n=1 Tax=Brachionus plicatilis TaxID=10195 RepID=A0A3M7Q7E5_BRAPC|nr:hypothetical protein BpHYR1_014338 [Brachionus plicatilis]
MLHNLDTLNWFSNKDLRRFWSFHHDHELQVVKISIGLKSESMILVLRLFQNLWVKNDLII